ncbi:MAG: hypothetical protein ACOCXA_09480 [Planctomycetota bacterium]
MTELALGTRTASVLPRRRAPILPFLGTWSLGMHLALAAIWLTAAAMLAGQISMAGSEEWQISRRRGAIDRELDAIARQQQHISAALDVASSRSRIAGLIRELQLPVRAPAEVAAREVARQ